jgi:hypothetical protein
LTLFQWNRAGLSGLRQCGLAHAAVHELSRLSRQRADAM